MNFRTRLLYCSITVVSSMVSGCATDGSSGGFQTFMQKCEAAATTEQERSECAWKNAERMASGGR